MLRGASTEIDYPYFPFRIPVDFVLVNHIYSTGAEDQRQLFEKALSKEGLVVRHETVGNVQFTLISVPFHRLCRQAESIQLCFPLRECVITPTTPTCCKGLSKVFVTDDEVRYINVPFQRKNGSLFLNYESEKCFFTTAQRTYLAYEILTKIDIGKDPTRVSGEPVSSTSFLEDPGNFKNLNSLLLDGVYDDCFVLHAPSKMEPYLKRLKSQSRDSYKEQVKDLCEDPRKVLSNRWERWYKFQPFTNIRNYFGEEIAFYFAWQGTFLTFLWPAAIFGVLVFLYGLNESLKTIIFYMDCSSECSFIEKLQLFWGYFNQLVSNAFINKFEAIFAVFMSLWGSIFIQVWKRNTEVLSYQWNCENLQIYEQDRPEFRGTRLDEDPITGEVILISPALIRYLKFIGSAIIVIFSMSIVIFSVFIVILYKIWAMDYFQCSQEYDFLCWTVTAFLPSTMNTVSTMLLGYFYSIIVEKLTRWENHRTETKHNSSLIIKLFAFQLVNTYTSLFYLAFIRPEGHGIQENGLLGLGKKYKDTCQDDTCASMLALQLLTHLLYKPIPKFTEDVVVPFIVRFVRIQRWKQKQMKMRNLKTSEEANVLVREYLKPASDNFVLWEMNEKIIFFGTTMMFASLFPLAPLITLIIGLIDTRIDAHRLLWFNRRPLPRLVNGIGIWLPILSFIQYSAVITNAFIVAFTSDFCEKMLSTECTIQSKLTLVIIFQNVVFILKYLIQSVIPEVPAGVQLAQRKRRYVSSYIMDKGDVPHRIRAKKKTRIAKIAWITSTRKNKRIGTAGRKNVL